MSAAAERPDAVAQAARRAAGALEASAARLESASPAVRMQALIASVLCARLGAGRNGLSARLAAGVASVGAQDVAGCDAGLLLLASAACRRVTGEIPPVLLEWLQLVGSVLPDGPPANPGQHHAAWVLWRMGLRCHAPHPVPEWPDARAMLFDDPPRLRQAERLLCARTEYGTRSVVAPADVQGAVRACAASSLARYDFDLAGRMLRAAAHLGNRDHRVVRWGREFMLHHQAPQGWFGFIARAEAYVRDTEPECDPLQLRMSYTLAALWTLAETNGRAWSLEGALLPAPGGSARLVSAAEAVPA